MSTPLSELMSCSICTETYTGDGIRIPYLLSCGHTFCLHDLITITITEPTRHIICPICRTCTSLTAEIPITTILACNVALLDIMSHQQQTQDQTCTSIGGTQKIMHNESPVCHVCADVGTTHSPATVWCHGCHVHLCDIHDKEEHVTIITKKHIRIPSHQHIDTYTTTCDQHMNPLQLFCTKCDVLVCATCALAGRHKGHDMIEPYEALQRLKGRLEPALERGQQEMKEMEHVREEVGKAITTVQQSSGQVITQIQYHFAAARAALDIQERELLTRVTANHKSLLLDLSSNDTNIANTMSHLDNALDIGHATINDTLSVMSALLTSSTTSVLIPMQTVTLSRVTPITWKPACETLTEGELVWEKRQIHLSTRCTFLSDRIYPGITLSSNNLIATKTGSKSDTSNLLCTLPYLIDNQYTYRVVIREGADINIGWSVPTLTPTHAQAYYTCGWYLYTHDGNLWSQSGDRGTMFLGQAIPSGTEITSTYNIHEHTISYGIGDTAMKLAFSNVDGELVPAIIPRTSNSVIELL